MLQVMHACFLYAYTVTYTCMHAWLYTIITMMQVYEHSQCCYACLEGVWVWLRLILSNVAWLGGRTGEFK